MSHPPVQFDRVHIWLKCCKNQYSIFISLSTVGQKWCGERWGILQLLTRSASLSLLQPWMAIGLLTVLCIWAHVIFFYDKIAGQSHFPSNGECPQLLTGSVFLWSIMHILKKRYNSQLVHFQVYVDLFLAFQSYLNLTVWCFMLYLSYEHFWNIFVSTITLFQIMCAFIYNHKL